MTHISVFLLILVSAISPLTSRTITDPFGGDMEDLGGVSNVDPLFEEEDSSECAYTTTGGNIATPLGSCWSFQQTQTSANTFSYDFTVADNGISLSWNYYKDLDCSELFYSTVMSAIHNSVGSGTNCETVDITKTGSYSKDSNECIVDENTKSDYYSMSYVINQCIQTAIDGQDLSVMWFCDEQKLYFDTYPHSNYCKGNKEQYIYHYYDDEAGSDHDDCWDIECNALSQQDDVMDSDGIQDAEKIKQYIRESVMMNEKYSVMDHANKQWVDFVVCGILVCAVLIGMVYCYFAIKNKEGSYTAIH